MEITEKHRGRPEPTAAAAGMNGAHTNESAVEEFLDSELSGAHHAASHLRPFGMRDLVESGPLPLVIGVSGHRDLREEDIPHLERVVLSEYSSLRAQYPSTPITLLSALADGADRLMARVALGAGMRLAVVLPMPIDLYETDFDAESIEEFHALLSKAEYSTELPIMPGLMREDIREHGINREQQYAQVGAYLASHSTILFALWDGVKLEKIGGTSQVVRYKLDGIPQPFAPPKSELDAPDRGPVYHIVTPRRSNPHPTSRAFAVHHLFPSGFASHAEADKANHDIYSRIEAFNHDAILYADDLKEHFRQSREYMFPAHAHPKHPHSHKKHHNSHAATSQHAGMSQHTAMSNEDVMREHAGMSNHPGQTPSMMQEDLDFYAIADVLSQRFQKRTKTIITLLLTFVFFAALFYEMYSGLFQEPVMLGLYLSMFVFSFFCYSWAERNGYQSKYLDYRALAEGLRVQFFWKLAGIEDSAADFYMRKQRSELDWIRHAIRTCTIGNTRFAGPGLPEEQALDRERLELALKYWVEDQAKYFARAAHRDHERLHGHERQITFLFGAALILAAVQAFVFREHNEYLLLGIGVFPVAGAVLHSWLQKNAFAETKRQYDRMSVFYHRATEHLQKLLGENRLADARAFLAELGREALAENGDWILMHRDRPLEVPKGA